MSASDVDLLRRGLLGLGLALPIAAVLPLSARGDEDTHRCESRALFDEGLHWTTPDGAERVCRRMVASGFNVLVACVWHGQGTTWPSSLAPWDRRVQAHVKRDARYDPFLVLLREARRHAIEVHAWFTIGRRSDAILPQFAEPLPARAFDFHKESFRIFMADLIEDFVERYPVDGVNLDYARFGGPRPGYEREREQLVSDVIERIAGRVRSRRPGALLSVDAAPWEPTMKQFGQDAVRWADEGLVDVAYSMQYQSEPDFGVIERLRQSMRRPEALTMILGNFDRSGPGGTVVTPRPAAHLGRLVSRARTSAPGNGVGVYYFGMLSDEQLAGLRASVFADTVAPCWKRATHAR